MNGGGEGEGGGGVSWRWGIGVEHWLRDGVWGSIGCEEEDGKVLEEGVRGWGYIEKG